jgi:hypothetical protein
MSSAVRAIQLLCGMERVNLMENPRVCRFSSHLFARCNSVVILPSIANKKGAGGESRPFDYSFDP